MLAAARITLAHFSVSSAMNLPKHVVDARTVIEIDAGFDTFAQLRAAP
jgi:hypothetical protein